MRAYQNFFQIGEGDYDDDKCAFIELDEAMKTVTDLIYKISEQITG